jgi:hypothetical protein
MDQAGIQYVISVRATSTGTTAITGLMVKTTNSMKKPTEMTKMTEARKRKAMKKPMVVKKRHRKGHLQMFGHKFSLL